MLANKDVLVEPVGFEELSPKEKPGAEPRFAKGEVDEAAGCVAAAEVVVEEPKMRVSVDPVAISDLELDKLRALERTNPRMDLKYC